MDKVETEVKSVRPSKVLIVNSIILFAICSFWIYGGAFSLFAALSPSGMFGGCMFLPLNVSIIFLQYYATFRRNAGTAFTVAIFNFIGAGFCLLAIITNSIEKIKEGLEDWKNFGLILSILTGVLVYCVFCGLLNYRWIKRLKQFEKDEKIPVQPVLKKNIYVWLLIGWVLLLIVVGGIHGDSGGYKSFEYAENVDKVSWLPDSATNISYYKSYHYTAYEFDIPEEDFLIWANKRRYPVKKISTPVNISRYNCFIHSKSETNYDEYINRSIEIKNGYFYEYRISNGGGVEVGYDLDTSRAYYQSNPR